MGKVLEMLCLKADMLKLMATIFKKDVPQAEFFKKALKFEMDETSFVDTVNEQFEYEILCRFNQIKKKKMEEEEGGTERISALPQYCGLLLIWPPGSQNGENDYPLS